tara:strand:+ start:274 stop:486 length:213 start_codon:yes stop_codon:yes gene_type:complete
VHIFYHDLEAVEESGLIMQRRKREQNVAQLCWMEGVRINGSHLGVLHLGAEALDEVLVDDSVARGEEGED